MWSIRKNRILRRGCVVDSLQRRIYRLKEDHQIASREIIIAVELTFVKCQVARDLVFVFAHEVPEIEARIQRNG